jgi:hypothetical protein
MSTPKVPIIFSPTLHNILRERESDQEDLLQRINPILARLNDPQDTLTISYRRLLQEKFGFFGLFWSNRNVEAQGTAFSTERQYDAGVAHIRTDAVQGRFPLYVHYWEHSESPNFRQLVIQGLGDLRVRSTEPSEPQPGPSHGLPSALSSVGPEATQAPVPTSVIQYLTDLAVFKDERADSN